MNKYIVYFTWYWGSNTQRTIVARSPKDAIAMLPRILNYSELHFTVTRIFQEVEWKD